MNAGPSGAEGTGTRCGFVAMVGAPNAGKSTLLNRMTGSKVAIVSPKAQTTRFRTLGIVIHDKAQIVFVDLPGVFKPRRKLDRAMVNAAWTGVQDADLALFMVDAKRGLSDDVREIAEQLSQSGRRVWLVLNKTDIVNREALLPLTAELDGILHPEKTFMVSAAKGEGVDKLLDDVAAAMPEGPWLYPEDEMTDLPDRLLAAELVREQVFLQTHEEIPYQATVETESYKERPDGSARIDVTIFVSRAGHKGILIGDGGRRIRDIGMKARRQLEEILGHPCHLFLNVKERAGWDEENARLRALGLDPHQA
ncbi:GTPase Era [Formicincola oecophyllae]|uniref:GTPase Era n=1 Tax=Formicincola oecophyllae TaxID=2558361 RepID=A0A4Y6UDC2_9PROT|nr:GTPase Era [Formicincola oecophyllae]QDH14447.1 GTPase Era [Formicincola oecophyllae]